MKDFEQKVDDALSAMIYLLGANHVAADRISAAIAFAGSTARTAPADGAAQLERLHRLVASARAHLDERFDGVRRELNAVTALAANALAGDQAS